MCICWSPFPNSSPITYINNHGRITHASKLTVLPRLSYDKTSNRNLLAGVFCQISTSPTSLPQGLRNHPAYADSTSPASPSYNDDSLPTYTSLTHPLHPPPLANEKSSQQSAPDVLHFLNHGTDSILSLSFRYGVPISALRRANGITSDHLLLARRTVLIPGEYYKGGVSLSPRPVEGEEEEARKGKIRRWMVACKVAEWVFLFLGCFRFAGVKGDVLRFLERKEADGIVPPRRIDTMSHSYT
jgi:hypothetical protein